MQQPLIHPRDDRNAYEYTIQATEDHHAAPSPTEDAPRRRGSPVWRSGSAPNYKPTPLRWPFITTVIALLLVGIVLVVVAEKRMPDSDGNAQILGIHPNATQPVRLARAVVFTNTNGVSDTNGALGSLDPSIFCVRIAALGFWCLNIFSQVFRYAGTLGAIFTDP
ncbi:hypothetical protein NEMBOFW57_002909 [Staphylotrichum longicolle]|uniref:Uncharacterized protein n=1 Tax=Staphylotrichum longicolle TaxID=669026 RepID=A0AAD4HZ37_9PEZI|nr:hypothetical protein NEMBOFW57_002909 [Staphylotrichum longicolle]